MPFDHSPCCPMCNTPISLRLVWNIAPLNRFGLLEQSTGVVCPTCSTKLRIVQGHSGLMIAALWSLFLVGAALAGQSAPPTRSLVLLFVFSLFIATAVFSGRIARRFARLRPREGTDTVDFPIERLKDQLKLPQTAEVATEGQPEGIDTPPWNCPKCRQDVPEGFGLCWKCGASYANGI
jgi:hypothetical protein